eukprot:1052644-Prymnesium_polylepis.1
MRSAAFSASMVTVALSCPQISEGSADASTTRSPPTPRSRRAPSRGAASSAPMRHEPQREPLKWHALART